MSEKETGGPAFPQQSVVLDKGMTLRDHFAGLALQGLLADTNLQGSAAEWAMRAYELADAMLEARK